MQIDPKLIRYRNGTRDLVVPGSRDETLTFCVKHFLGCAQDAIAARGQFHVALSGGSTPKAIFQRLGESPEAKKLDWSRVLVFWSDERAVPPNDPDSNYHMAMTSGLQLLPIPAANIFRMVAEESIEENALAYEKTILAKVPGGVFDLITLGMGEDGHTASLFPETEALNMHGRFVVANYVSGKKSWRMTFTFDCINAARCRCLYVMGQEKAGILADVFLNERQDIYPSQRVGTPEHRALWIADEAAASQMKTE
jgi:6-phosphogluconolactonase